MVEAGRGNLEVFVAQNGVACVLQLELTTVY